MINTKELLEALRTVGRVCPSRTSMPILKTVKLVSDGQQLHVTANNSEVNMTCSIACELPVFQSCPQASELERIIATIEDANMTLAQRDDLLIMEFGKHSFKFKSMNVDEFPIIDIEPQCTFDIDGDVLSSILDKTAFACATDQSHPVLTGISLKSDGQILTVSSADGLRASHIKMMMGLPPFDIIVPNENLNQLTRTMSGKAQVNIGKQSFNIVGEGFSFTSQLIAGSFPEVERIVNSCQPEVYVVVDRQALLRAFTRAAVFARDVANVVEMDIHDKHLLIKSADTEGNEGHTVLDVITHIGASVSIAVNSIYMREILAALKTSTIKLNIEAPVRPLQIKLPDNENFVHVIMPMHLGRK